MESFGEYLKRERELRNISLDQISKVTRIGKRYLQALESNRCDLLPGKAFARGFLRGYCRIVGLDPDEVLLRFDSSLEAKPTVPPETPRVQRGAPPWLAYAVPPLLILAVFLFIISVGKGKPPVHEERRQSPPAQPMKENPVPPESDTEAPEPAAPDQRGLVLKAKALKDTWIMVRSDDQQPADILLKSGEEYGWKAREKLSLRIGNAGGVSLILNDKPLGPLGPEGKVVGLVFSAP